MHYKIVLVMVLTLILVGCNHKIKLPKHYKTNQNKTINQTDVDNINSKEVLGNSQHRPEIQQQGKLNTNKLKNCNNKSIHCDSLPKKPN